MFPSQSEMQENQYFCLGKMVKTYLNPKKTIKVGLVGKYINHQDAYKSVVEALYHGGIAHNVKVEVIGFDAETAKMLTAVMDIWFLVVLEKEVLKEKLP